MRHVMVEAKPPEKNTQHAKPYATAVQPIRMGMAVSNNPNESPPWSRGAETRVSIDGSSSTFGSI